MPVAFVDHGRVAERLNAPVLKTGRRATPVSGVRISPLPLAAESQLEPRTVWLLLAGATFLAAALRLPFLGHESLWLDEIYTREIVREASLAGVWNHLEATESTPPLFYVLEWLAHARGAVALRLVPALSLTAAVPVAYLAFRRLVGQRAALASAAIVAVNPMLVFYSTDARGYGLFVLSALLSVWAFSALLEGASRRRFGLWALASVACVWTHYFGVFVVAAEVVALLVARPRLRLATAGWTALLAVCLAPLIPLVASQSGDERAGFIAGIPLATRISGSRPPVSDGPKRSESVAGGSRPRDRRREPARGDRARRALAPPGAARAARARRDRAWRAAAGGGAGDRGSLLRPQPHRRGATRRRARRTGDAAAAGRAVGSLPGVGHRHIHLGGHRLALSAGRLEGRARAGAVDRPQRPRPRGGPRKRALSSSVSRAPTDADHRRPARRAHPG